MNKNISIISILKSVLTDFKKWKFSFFIFLSIFIILVYCTFIFHEQFILPYLRMKLPLLSCRVTWYQLFTIVRIFYLVVITKNILDMVYHRKLHWYFLSLGMLKTFVVSSIVVLLRDFAYSQMHRADLIELFFRGTQSSDVSYFTLIIYFIMCVCIFYLSIRTMFVEQFLLEKKCTVVQAFTRSLRITKEHFLLIVLSGSIVMCLLLSPLLLFNIIGYFIRGCSYTAIYILLGIGSALMMIAIECYIMIPLALLLKSHLFKALIESERV